MFVGEESIGFLEGAKTSEIRSQAMVAALFFHVKNVRVRFVFYVWSANHVGYLNSIFIK